MGSTSAAQSLSTKLVTDTSSSRAASWTPGLRAAFPRAPPPGKIYTSQCLGSDQAPCTPDKSCTMELCPQPMIHFFKKVVVVQNAKVIKRYSDNSVSPPLPPSSHPPRCMLGATRIQVEEQQLHTAPHQQPRACATQQLLRELGVLSKVQKKILKIDEL